MKQITKFLSLLSILGISFLLGILISTDVKGISDLNYTFIDNILYDSSSITLNDTFNLSNKTEYSQDYNATYSFTNEVGLESEAISFVENDDSEPKGIVKIITELEGHSEVLNLSCIDGDKADIYNNIDNIISGTIEGWIQTNYISTWTYFCNLQGNGGTALFLAFNANQIAVYNNSINYLLNANINTWYHYSLDFECGNGEYLGLDNDTTRISINGINYGIFNFGTNSDYINSMRLLITQTEQSIYIDGIGFTWDNHYDINDNIEPLLNYSSEIGVIYDEFGFDVNGVQYDTGWDTEANNWSAPYGGVNLGTDESQAYDRRLSIVSSGTIATKKITKNFYASDGIFKIDTNIDYLAMLNPNSYFLWNISSSLDNAIALVRIIYEASEFRLQYSNVQDGSNFITLTTIDTTNMLKRNLSLYINDKFCLLSYQDANTPISQYTFYRLSLESGLYRVDVISKMVDNDDSQTLIMDSIGVLINGSRYVNDYGIYNLNLSVSNWNSETYNLLKIKAFGNFSIGVHSTYFGGNYESIANFYNYNGSVKNYNSFSSYFSLNNPFFAFITNGTITIDLFKITGIKITESTNTYYPAYYSGSVDTDESFFYVDSNNRLQFNLIANDNNTEYIELRLYLITKTTENRSVSFRSDINGVSQGYLHFAYWGFTTTDIYFPYYLGTTITYLPQAYIIYTLSIIISDLDMTWYDNCEGYITNLKLLNTPQGVQGAKLIDIDITNLIMLIIPLIVLLAPSIAISIKFGKKAILPMFILMSVICVATELIPFWLFFIMVLGSGALLIGQYKRDDE